MRPGLAAALLILIKTAPAAQAPAPEAKPPPASAQKARQAALRGHALYYRGELSQALSAYEEALRADRGAVEAWSNGAVVLEELGRPDKAVEWYGKASLIAPEDARLLAALGWVELRRGQARAAEAHFRSALNRDPAEVQALVGLGRSLLAQKRADEAVAPLTQAASLAPEYNLAHYFKGEALDAVGDTAGAILAYRKAAANDSYLAEARYALGLAYLRAKRYPEANAQFGRVLEASPDNPKVRQLKQKVDALAQGKVFDPSRRRPVPGAGRRATVEVLMPARGRVPILRVGIGTTAMGRPLSHKALEFQSSTPFVVVEAKSGRRLAGGPAREAWQVRVAYGKKPRFEVFDPDHRRAAVSAAAIVIRPQEDRGGTVLLKDIPFGTGHRWSGVAPKHLRGAVELSWHPDRRSFKIVSLVDLESYTHGVLSAEMPITSPLEALKGQSVVARTHALYIKTQTRRHHKNGYDLCDEQHCQVYTGVSAESERSRAVVDATRGRIVAYKGKVALLLYSSNCGGHTQSGRDVTGWGNIPYWQATPDSPAGAPAPPGSPWELKWWLRRAPVAYCRPTGSGHVHPAHHRWSRYVLAKDIEHKLNRDKAKLGRLLGIRTLRRSVSGHLNGVLFKGSKRDIRVTQEIRIRSLMGLGSQRSALFVMDTEYGEDGKPRAFLFHGGGWGHGVGMCQSGSMGRAEQGQTYDDILKAYYVGTELGNLRY